MSGPRIRPEAADEALHSRTRDGGARSGAFVGGALAIGACLVGLIRFVRLGEWSLWLDEVLTIADFQNRLGEGNLINQAGYALIAAVAGLFDPADEAFALRFLPALAGWLHLPAMWLLWKRPLGPIRAGAAALLLAVSPWHLYWSQNVRFYTLASLLAFVGVSLAFRIFFAAGGSPCPKKFLVGLFGFALTALAIFFHPSTSLAVVSIVLTPWFVWLLLGFGVAAENKKSPARLLAMSLVVLALLGTLLAYPRLSEAFSNYSEQKFQASPAGFLLTTGYYFHPAVCAAALVGGIVAWRRKKPQLVGLAVFLVICGVGALGASLQARIVAQYVFFALPFVFLLACSPLERPWRGAHLALYGGLFAALLAGSLLYLTRYQGERPRWKDAYEWVYHRAGDEDMIIGMAAPVGEFYISPQTEDYRRPERVAWTDYFRPRRMQETARFARRMWIVIHPDWFGDWKPQDAEDAQAFLHEQCRMVQEFPLPVGTRDLGVQVYLRE